MPLVRCFAQVWATRPTLVRWQLRAQELNQRQTDVAGNLSQQERRDISASVKRNRGGTPIRMSELFVGAALPNFDEAEPFKTSDDFTRLEYRTARHDYAT